MTTVLLNVPIDLAVREFVQLILMFRDAGYRISDAVIKIDSADVTFQKIGASESGN